MLTPVGMVSMEEQEWSGEDLTQEEGLPAKGNDDADKGKDEPNSKVVGAHKLPQLPPVVDLAGVIDVVIEDEDEYGQLEKDEANPPRVPENHERKDPSGTQARCCSIVQPI